ncbi:MAG: glycosyltransferase family 4 protein [Novosphingobium sp.]|nr:glycosyltransferase family 4 protein [Novosphingobium sp.]
MNKVAVIHPGTQHSWQTAYALQQLGQLEYYATSIFYQPDRWPYRVERYLPASLGRKANAQFRRFSHAGLDPALVRTSGMLEWIERIARRKGLPDLARRLDEIGNARFGRGLAQQLLRDGAYALWCYDNSALDLFKVARTTGRMRILDRTIADWRAYNAIMRPVFEQYREFFPGSAYAIPDDWIERNQAEYELADVILTGCEFAARTVRDHAGAAVASKVRVLNYCYDELLFANRAPPAPRQAKAPLRFLFVGQAGVRKGIHLALEAIARIPASAATLTIVGELQVPPEVFTRYADRVTHIPTVARSDMPGLMAEADVLLFPTYFEGAGIVLYEALASGMGLIQSAQADVAVTPETGILLPDLTGEALYEAMMTAIERRDLVDTWRASAPVAALAYSFDRYRDNIAAMLDELQI